MRNCLSVVASIAIAAVLSVAGPQATHPASTPAKLDRAVQEWLEHPTGSSMRVLIRTAPGAAAGVRARLLQVAGRTVDMSSSPDLLVAQLSSAGIGVAERDREVAGISSDALVRGTGQLLQKVPTAFDLVSSLQAANLNHLPRKNRRNRTRP